MLKSVIEALAFRRISVMISLHTLTPFDNGELWYSAEVPEADVLEAVDILADDLCNDEHWNVLDDFEGEQYKRVLTEVCLDDGSLTEAHIYILRRS